MTMSGKSPAEFVADLKKFAEVIDIDFGIAVKKVVFEAFTRIVMRSPVDTGRFRSSWTLQEGTPNESVKPEGQYDVPAPGGLPAMWESTPPPDVADQVSGFKLSKPYTTVWINNSLPYAEALEFGHSKQAPHGMVRLTAAEITTYINLMAKRAGDVA